MTLSAGTRLAPYEISALLGAGGMGEVYRARDTRLGRDVAVKVIPEELATDQDRLARFEQEARLAGSLSHPNVLTLHDVGMHGGAPYLVTELLEGRSLRDLLERRRAPPVMPEGIVSLRGSYRDGTVIGMAADGTLARCPLQGGDPQPMAARLPPGSIPLRVSGDGRFVFVGRERFAMPYWVDRLELATGRLASWKALRPEDSTGVPHIVSVVLTADGEAYAYTYGRYFHDLHLVEGLR